MIFFCQNIFSWKLIYTDFSKKLANKTPSTNILRNQETFGTKKNVPILNKKRHMKKLI